MRSQPAPACFAHLLVLALNWTLDKLTVARDHAWKSCSSACSQPPPACSARLLLVSLQWTHVKQVASQLLVSNP